MASLYKTLTVQRSNGRQETDEGYTEGYEDVGVMRAILSGATTREAMIASQADFVVTHVVVHQGPPRARLRDRLRYQPAGQGPLGDAEPRYFHVHSVDNAGEMDLATTYLCEERRS